MSSQKFMAELFGTFTLAFIVWLSIAFTMPFSTPVMAGLTLGLLVYTVGGISGAHLNPAVTLAIMSIRKISPHDAAYYIVAQLIGASLAMILGILLAGHGLALPQNATLMTGVGEAIGAFFLCFTVSAATLGKIQPGAAGIAVGTSLFIGIFTALHFSNAILNPAVALGLGSVGPMYVLGPVIGALLGAWLAHWIFADQKKGKKAWLW